MPREFRSQRREEFSSGQDVRMFGAVMQDAEICKGVIERLLKIKIKRIEYPELQKTINPFYNQKGVRLDVYVADSDKIFDVECQTYDEKTIGRRVRYYQSMLDADSLLKGTDYADLKESYVLFICLNDPFKLGLPVYTFERKCQESEKADLGDASHSVIFNSSAWKDENDSELRAFLSFVKGNSAQSHFTRRISEMVRQKKFEQTFINEYMAWNLHDSDVKKQAAAQQKAEDDKLLQATVAQVTAQKEALLSSKDAENARQAAEIQRLLTEIEKLKAKL